MHPARFFAASRVVIVAGKGGVGKTTVSAALARAAARAGLSTLVVEVEGKSGLATLFDQDRFPVEHHHKFVDAFVPVALARPGARLEHAVADADIGEARRLTDATVKAPHNVF